LSRGGFLGPSLLESWSRCCADALVEHTERWSKVIKLSAPHIIFFTYLLLNYQLAWPSLYVNYQFHII
jgi:hypothetical protein